MLACGLSGCRGDAPVEGPPVDVRISVAPTPPVIGPARLVVTVFDSIGAPIDEAEVRVEGMMTHAGMVPVHEAAEAAGEGLYVVPAFEFTMGGDWILVARVRLPDGREALHRQESRVVSGGPGGG